MTIDHLPNKLAAAIDIGTVCRSTTPLSTTESKVRRKRSEKTKGGISGTFNDAILFLSIYSS